MCGIFFYFSALLANMVGGVLYDAVGGHMLFRYVAVLCGIWTLLMLIYYGGKYLQNRKLYTFENSMKYDNSGNRKETVSGIENPAEVVDDEENGVKMEAM